MLVTCPEHRTFCLAPGEILTVVADAVSAGTVYNLGSGAGAAAGALTAVAASETKQIGPFAVPTCISVVPSAGFLTVTQGLPTAQQILDSLTGIDADTSGNLTANKVTLGQGAPALVFANGQGLYTFTTAITANSTTTAAPAGSLGITSHATGAGKLFQSDGSKWQFAGVA